MDIDPFVIGLPLLAALGVLLALGWRREMKRRSQVNEALWRLPEGAAAISTDALSREIRKELIGGCMAMCTGTYGLNQLGRLLVVLDQCGLERLVGSVLVIENDAQLRHQFHQDIPAVFHDRIVYGYSDAWSPGMSNWPIQQIMAHIDKWGPPIVKATAEVIDLHLRRNGARAPSNILAFISQGGQAPLGLPVIEKLYERFEETLVIGLTALPRHERLRQRFAQLKGKYEAAGVFGWVLQDNLGPDPVTSDYGMVALIVGLADAALHADQAVQPNNAFSLTFTEERGAVLVYQVAHSTVVGYKHAPNHSRQPRYYVFKQPVVEQVLHGLRKIEESRGLWSAELPVGEPGTSIFDVVLVSLYPDDLREVQDEVNAGRRLLEKEVRAQNGDRAVRLGRPNYEAPFASIATVIDPEKPVCPVIVIRMAAVRDGAKIVDEIVKVPQARMLLALPSGGNEKQPEKEVTDERTA